MNSTSTLKTAEPIHIMLPTVTFTGSSCDSTVGPIPQPELYLTPPRQACPQLSSWSVWAHLAILWRHWPSQGHEQSGKPVVYHVSSKRCSLQSTNARGGKGETGERCPAKENIQQRSSNVWVWMHMCVWDRIDEGVLREVKCFKLMFIQL